MDSRCCDSSTIPSSGSDPELGEAGRAFVDVMNGDLAHLYGFLMPGALAMYVGNILLAIALLRARTGHAGRRC